jgi:hypothetical protein
MTTPNVLSEAQYIDEKKEHLAASELVETGLYTTNLLKTVEGVGAFALQDTVQVIEMSRRGDVFDLTFISHLTGLSRSGRVGLGGIMLGSLRDDDGSFSEGYFKSSQDDIDEELWGICEKEEERFEPARLPIKQTEHKHLALPLPTE